MTAGLPSGIEKLASRLLCYIRSSLRLHFHYAFLHHSENKFCGHIPAPISIRPLQMKISIFALLGLLSVLGLTSSAIAGGSGGGFQTEAVIENVSLVDLDRDAETIDIEFDIGWDNAWRNSVNHSAMWVFAKYCSQGCTTSGSWHHVYLKSSGLNPSGFEDGTRSLGNFSSLNILVPDDKSGAFFIPATQGEGSVKFIDAHLVWDFSSLSDSITGGYWSAEMFDDTISGMDVRIRVYGIEMVYIPEGGFYAGDGSSGSDGEFEYGSSSSLPAFVSSEESIYFSDVTSAGWYYNTDPGYGDDNASGATFVLGEPFPKGYQAFYMMRREMSQSQWADFLNSLSQAQQANHVASTITNETAANKYVMTDSGSVVSRQTVKAGANPSDGNPYTFGCDLEDDNVVDETTDGEWIAMNYISWPDLLAYADWAALRPMTELEFEKACRGPVYPVLNEYCWGSTDLTDADTIANSGTTSETVSNAGDGLANYGNDGVLGPLRSGFANGPEKNRETSGSSYYGVLDLSGNLFEQAVTVGNSTGRSFGGSHGDGALNSNGYATNDDWPGFVAGSGVTGTTGSGLRGGSWNQATSDYLQTSSRYYGGAAFVGRANNKGGRLTRTAP